MRHRVLTIFIQRDKAQLMNSGLLLLIELFTLSHTVKYASGNVILHFNCPSELTLKVVEFASLINCS